MDSLGRSRFEPKDPNGVIEGTPRELDVLQLIHRLPYIPSHYIDRYFDLAYHAAEIRAELHAKDYIANHLNAAGKDSWTTTRKGAAFLGRRRPAVSLYSKGAFSRHQRFCMLIAYGFLFGAKEQELDFGYPEDALNHPDCPPIDVANPFAYVIAPGDKYLADGKLFRLSYQNRYMFFWGWEADLKTESLDSEAENSIKNKLRKQEHFLAAD